MILARKPPFLFTTKIKFATGPTVHVWLGALVRPLLAISNGIIARRTEQADRYIEGRLPMMSDAELAHFGIGRDQIDSFIEERRKARRVQRISPDPRFKA